MDQWSLLELRVARFDLIAPPRQDETAFCVCQNASGSSFTRPSDSCSVYRTVHLFRSVDYLSWTLQSCEACGVQSAPSTYMLCVLVSEAFLSFSLSVYSLFVVPCLNNGSPVRVTSSSRVHIWACNNEAFSQKEFTQHFCWELANLHPQEIRP